MSQERVEHLAQTRAPATRYSGRGLSEVRNRLKHEAASRRYVRRDRGAKALQRDVEVWSSAKGPGLARSGRLATLHGHLLHAQPVPKLYRGMATTTSYKRGQNVTLPISSFTADRKVAQRFAAHRAKQVGGKPMVMEVRNARALHVSPLVRRRGIGMQEWVGQGEFRVTRGGTMPRLVAVNKAMPEVAKAMPSTLSVPRPLGTLRRASYRDSHVATYRRRSGNLVPVRRRAGMA